jgi:alpha-beta hydrolase superfamily lysophospholipase
MTAGVTATKIRFKNSEGLLLAGAYYPANGKAAVIISHGFTSNKDRPHFVRLAEQLSDAGFAVLRFDFSGCGESDPAPITIEGELDDLRAAMEWMRQKGHSTLGLLGSSLGGLVSLQAYSPSVKTMVLWAPVTGPKDPAAEKRWIAQTMKAEETKDSFVLRKPDGREFRIGKAYVQERAKVDPKKLLSEVKCPVLIIHGDADQTVPIEGSKKAINGLPKGSKLEIVPGAGHRFADNERDLQHALGLSVEWFKRYR